MDSACCFGSKFFPRKEERSKINRPSSGIPEAICRRFTMAEMERATKCFDPEKVIGDGFFGTVYRGCVDDDQVAIKRWNPAAKFQFRSMFWKEAKLCCQLRHPNLVEFKGFCDDRGEMIRVYEYMPNNSLDHHLFGGGSLAWRPRLQICIDVARGLHYLHCGVKRPIIHRNVRTNRILVGEDWAGKLSDIGLSKVPKELIKVEATSEYIGTGELLEKSDVYSFGEVLFQVLSGRKVFDDSLEEPNLIEWASKCIQRGEIDEMVDPRVKGQIAQHCLRRFVAIAEKCVSWDRTERPGMGEVQVALEEALEVQEKPDLGVLRI